MSLAILAFAAVIGLSLLGVRIAFASLLVGFIGFGFLRGWHAAQSLVGQQVVEHAMSYNLSVIPLFVLMGVFIYRSNIANELYDAAHAGLGGLKGGLAHSTVVASAGFAAVCGSSLATAATMTRVAMPSMKSRGYAERLSAGTIAAGGTLGIMIPPSVPLVIYGIVAEQDVGQLFIAGVVPGLLLVVLFLITISIWATVSPSLVPTTEVATEALKQTSTFKSTLPILGLFVLVLGGIYGKVFTPTEAAGIGAIGAATIAVFRGHFRTLSEWREGLVEAAITTAALFMVLFGTTVFAQLINLTGLPYDLVRIVQSLQLSPLGLVVSIAIITVLMGMIFEAIGILLLIVPVFLPALVAADVNLIWFGIIVVLVTELGLITPPVGMNVFVVKSAMPELRVATIFAGVLPFVLAIMVALFLVLMFPAIATFLPNHTS